MPVLPTTATRKSKTTVNRYMSVTPSPAFQHWEYTRPLWVPDAPLYYPLRPLLKGLTGGFVFSCERALRKEFTALHEAIARDS